MSSNKDDQRVRILERIPVLAPKWFLDLGFEDCMERMIVGAAFLNCHIGCLRWIQFNGHKLAKPGLEDTFNETMAERIIEMAEISMSLTDFVQNIIDSGPKRDWSLNIDSASSVLQESAEWLERLQAVLDT